MQRGPGPGCPEGQEAEAGGTQSAASARCGFQMQKMRANQPGSVRIGLSGSLQAAISRTANVAIPKAIHGRATIIRVRSSG